MLTCHSSLHIEGNQQDGPLQVQIVKLPAQELAIQATKGGTANLDNPIEPRAEGDGARRILYAGET